MLISQTICHRGLVREQNEDSYISNLNASIWLVADGVGGNVGGDIASQLAVQTIERSMRQGSSLAQAIWHANESICSAIAKQESLQGMATTIVAAAFSEKNYELAWVGDSRAYLISPNAIEQLSSDHNVANERFLKGLISKEALAKDSGQHELTQALGQLSLSNIPCLSGSLTSDSILLLCSDGLSGVLSDEEILDICKRGSSLDEMANSLLSHTLEAGAPDNVTFSLIACAQYPSADPEAKGNTHLAEQSQSKNHKSLAFVANKAPITWLVLFISLLILLVTFYVD